MSAAIEVRQQQFAQWRSWATWAAQQPFSFISCGAGFASVFTNELMLDLGITARDYGALGSIYYISYGSVQLFVGLILDRLGVRYPLAIAALMIMTGCLMYALATSMTVLLIARLLPVWDLHSVLVLY